LVVLAFVFIAGVVTFVVVLYADAAGQNKEAAQDIKTEFNETYFVSEKFYGFKFGHYLGYSEKDPDPNGD
tara:strand:- start:1219 stop:1428 length:210 start_codon:yes stop_codon:yes gene_type:complete